MSADKKTEKADYSGKRNEKTNFKHQKRNESGVPKLYPGEKTNLTAFKEALMNNLTEQFGFGAYFIANLKYEEFVVDEPVDWVLEPVLDDGGQEPAAEEAAGSGSSGAGSAAAAMAPMTTRARAAGGAAREADASENSERDENETVVDGVVMRRRAKTEFEKKRDELRWSEKEKLAIRRQEKYNEDKPKIFAIIWKNLSEASKNLVKSDPSYDEVKVSQCPLSLWRIVLAQHQLSSAPQNNASERKRLARVAYSNAVSQGAYESLRDYKVRVEEAVKMYVATGNPEMDSRDVLADVVNGLDSRYADFVREYRNRVSADLMEPYETFKELEDALRDYIPPAGARPTGGSRADAFTVYNTTHHSKKGEGSKAAQPSGDKNRSVADLICYNCGGKGHIKKDCTKKKTTTVNCVCICGVEVGDEDDGSNARLLLDSGAATSIIPWSMAEDIRRMAEPVLVGGYTGGQTVISHVGVLPGMERLGDVLVTKGRYRPVLCFGDVERAYDVTYDKGVFTVHAEKPLTFVKGSDNQFELSAGVAEVMDIRTVKEMEGCLNARQLRGLQRARKFISNAGCPGVDAALQMIADGNINGLDFTGDDVKRAFEIQNSAAAARGKTTRSGPVSRRVSDSTLVARMDAVPTTLETDVMHAMGGKYLVSHASPSGLGLSLPLSHETREKIGEGIQAHVNIMRSHGAVVEKVKVEPTPAMEGLRGGKILGARVETVGAGDHLPNVDALIRRKKEIARCVTAELREKGVKVPRKFRDELDAFATVRKNQRGGYNGTHIAPKTGVTGRRFDMNKEFKYGFMNYVEAYNNNVTSNDVTKERTSPCLTMYPTGNEEGSWRLYNLRTGKFITRTDAGKARPYTEEILAWIAALHEPEARAVAPQQQVPDKAVQREPDDIDDVDGDDVAIQDEQADVGGDGGVVEAAEQDDVEDVAADNDDESGDDGRSADENPTVAMSPRVVELGDLDSPAAEIGVADVDGDEASDAGVHSLPPPYEEIAPDVARQRAAEGQSRRYNLRSSARGTTAVDSAGGEGGEATMSGKEKKIRKTLIHHISCGKGLKKHGTAAVDSLMKEVRGLVKEREAISPVLKEKLVYKELDKIIRSHVFFKEKFDAEGIFQKLKARLVANGKQQDRLLYPDRSSPTANSRSVMSVVRIAALERRHMGSFDVPMAFVHADAPPDDIVIIEVDALTSEVIARHEPDLQPFVGKNGKMLFRVNKALYGLIQSAKLWYEKLRGVLNDMCFLQNPVDECVFNRVKDGVQTTMVIHVDDILATCVNRDHLVDLGEELKSHFGEVTVCVGDNLSYLGMHIVRAPDGAISVDMDHFINELLEYAPPESELGKSSPAQAKLFDEQGANDRQLVSDGAKAVFHTTTAKLLYLSKRLRFDLSVAVAYLTSKVTCATIGDLKRLKRVINNLAATKDMRLVFPTDGDMQLEAYIDASFGIHQDGKSHTGMVMMLGGAPIAWKSSKQKMCGKDSTEAELIGLSDRLEEVVVAQQFLEGQGYDMTCPLIHQDNQSVITLVTQGGGRPRTRHLNVRRAMVKQLVESGDVKIVYCRTVDMLADLFTKPLQGALLYGMVKRISNGPCAGCPHTGVRCN